MTQATLTKTGIVVGRSTMVYTTHHGQDGVQRQVFIPVRDLINDARDPQIATVNDRANSPMRTFNPLLVREHIEDKPRSFWSCHVVSTSGLTAMLADYAPVLHADAVVYDFYLGAQKIGHLMRTLAAQMAQTDINVAAGKRMTGHLFRLKTYSFSELQPVFSDVVICAQEEQRTKVQVDADSGQWASAHGWVILSGGLMLSK